MAAILEIKDVCKHYGRKTVVDHVSFSVNEGEIFGFLGPNGAGKTTVIKMITGLIRIDSGEIHVNGYNVAKNFEKAMARVGGIIENPEMYGYLTGRTNLKLYARMHKNVEKSRFDEIIDTVKLGNRIDDKVKKYSLGMRQRLGVAQAILHQPNLLVLDEPTNGLDPVGIKELRDTLHTLTREHGVAVLVSSHLLSEMELMCDRFGIIDNGRMIDIKTMGDIQEDGQNLIRYHLEVSDVEKASRIAADLTPDSAPAIDGAFIDLSVTRDEIAQLNKAWIENGLLVYELSPVKKSLEEEFMDITNGSKAQIR